MMYPGNLIRGKPDTLNYYEYIQFGCEHDPRVWRLRRDCTQNHTSLQPEMPLQARDDTYDNTTQPHKDY